MLQTTKIKKIRFKMSSWTVSIRLPLPVDNVTGIKVRWIVYVTASANNQDLQLSCREFPASGYNLLDNGATDDYFFSTPLDPSADVSCIFSDYSGPVDIPFQYKQRSINQMTIQAFINGAPAIDISPANPLSMELGFYYE